MIRKDTYIYVAFLTIEEKQVRIRFPDLPGCHGCAPTEEKAFCEAKLLLRDWLLAAERKIAPIPESSSLSRLNIPENAHACLIQVCLAPFREAYNNRAIKKTLTIPAWLNDLAEKEKVNFSFVLQQALKEQLGLNK